MRRRMERSERRGKASTNLNLTRRTGPVAAVHDSDHGAGFRYDAFVKARVVWLLILLVVAGALAYHYIAAFRLFTFFAVGRSPICPLAEAVKADDNLQQQVDYKDQILNASK